MVEYKTKADVVIITTILHAAAKNMNPPSIHDLFYILQGFSQIYFDQKLVMKAITRYANLQKCSDAQRLL